MIKHIRPVSLVFLFTIIISTILSISTNNFILIWVGLEINIISFIPLIIETNSKNKNVERAIKYFIIQAPSSILLIINLSSFIFNTLLINNTYDILLLAILLIKVGAAPFHIWLPQVIKSLRWINCLLLLTWQKITPLVILIVFDTSNTNIIIFNIAAVIRSLVGSLGGLAQTQIRPLLAYSSISHFAWILSAYLVKFDITIIYFLFYSLLNIIIITPLPRLNSTSAINFKLTKQIHKDNQSRLWIDIISLAGLPPLLGFIPKWIVIIALIPYVPILVYILIFTSMITLFFYLRVITSIIITSQRSLYNHTDIKWGYILIWARIPIFFYLSLTDDLSINRDTTHLESTDLTVILSDWPFSLPPLDS